jgi:hypothetical protein
LNRASLEKMGRFPDFASSLQVCGPPTSHRVPHAPLAGQAFGNSAAMDDHQIGLTPLDLAAGTFKQLKMKTYTEFLQADSAPHHQPHRAPSAFGLWDKATKSKCITKYPDMPKITKNCGKIEGEEDCKNSLEVEDKDKTLEQMAYMCKWGKDKRGRAQCVVGSKCNLPSNLDGWKADGGGGDDSEDGGGD